LNFKENARGLNLSRSQVLGGRGAVQDTTHLLGIEFGKLLLGHKVDKEVVSNLRVSIDTFRVSLGHTLGENTRIFGVEQEVDSGKLNVSCFTAIVPVAGEFLAIAVVGVDEDRSPYSTSVVVTAETLSGDGLEATIFSFSESEPFFRHAAVVLSIIKRLKGEPVSRVSRWVSVVDSL
jgi:hypothetical protein